MPSRSEGLPYVALEAMSYQIPIIGFSVGGMSEVISDGDDGILVPEGNVSEFVGAVLRLIDDPILRKRMGENAHDTVKNRFSKKLEFR